jgi:hypothetical protein
MTATKSSLGAMGFEEYLNRGWRADEGARRCLTAGCADADHAVRRLITVAGVRAVLRWPAPPKSGSDALTRSSSLPANFGLRAVAFPVRSDGLRRLYLGLRRREVERSPRNRQCQASALHAASQVLGRA